MVMGGPQPPGQMSPFLGDLLEGWWLPSKALKIFHWKPSNRHRVRTSEFTGLFRSLVVMHGLLHLKMLRHFPGARASVKTGWLQEEALQGAVGQVHGLRWPATALFN